MNSLLRRGLRPPWTWIAVVVVLSIWGLTDVRNRGRIDPADFLAHKSDLTCYTEAAKAFFDGRDPYEVANPRGWRYLYPPLFAILLAPLAEFDSQTQVVLWFFFNLLVAWGCYRESIRIVRLIRPAPLATPQSPESANAEAATASSPPPAWLTWIAAATMTLPFLNTLQRGQVGILVAYLLLLGLRLVAVSVSWRGAALGGIVLAGAINLKLTPALPAAMLLAVLALAAIRSGWLRRRVECASGAVFGSVAGLALFFLLLPAAAVGWNANLHHLHTWVGKVVFNHDLGGENDLSYRSVRNQSLVNAASRLGNWTAYVFFGGPNDEPSESAAPQSQIGNGNMAGSDISSHVSSAPQLPMEKPFPRRALMAARLGLLALLAAVGWRAAAAGTALDIAAAFGMACIASLLVSPLSWAHHYPVALPGLLAVPLWQWRRSSIRMAKWLAGGACALVWTHYLLLDWAGRAGVLGLGTTVWFIFAALWMLRSGASEVAHDELAGATPGAGPLKAKAA
jgi:hypothetical protein